MLDFGRTKYKIWVEILYLRTFFAVSAVFFVFLKRSARLNGLMDGGMDESEEDEDEDEEEEDEE